MNVQPFELNNVELILKGLNARTENHGEEQVSATDILLAWETDNSALALFHPQLKASFYKAENDGFTPQVDLDLRFLKFPKMGGHIKWESEIVGATVTIHAGVTEKSHIKFVEAKVDKFQIVCKEGGRIVVSFKISCYPDGKQFGVLYGLMSHIIEISIEPPKEGKIES
jgi:hypothetical protein